ncbi:MAG: hypothetical protein QM648_04815 [Solirubrobacterales bacterium]
MRYLSFRIVGVFVVAVSACLAMTAPAGATNSNNTVTFTDPAADGAVLPAPPTVEWTIDGSITNTPTCQLVYDSDYEFNSPCSSSAAISSDFTDYLSGIYRYAWDTTSLINPVGDGTFTVVVNPPWSNAGGSTTFARSFTVDTMDPTVLMTAPSLTSDSTPQIHFTIQDANPGTTSYSVDGGGYTSVASSPFDLPAIADGTHDIRVRHVDLAGNTTTESRSVTIDATAPVISISGLASGQVVESAYVPVTVSASDGAGTGLTTLGCGWDVAPTLSCGGNEFVNQILADGAHTLNISASDALGNVATLAVAFTVDTSGGLKPALVAPKSGAIKLKRGKLKSGKYPVTTTTTFTIPPGGTKADCKGTASTRVLLGKKQLTSGKVKWKASGGKCTATSAVKLKKLYKGKKLTLILDYKDGPIKAFRLSKSLKL